MKDVLRCGLLESCVPHEADSVGVRGGLGILVIGGSQQLGKNGAPVQGGDGAVLRPAIVVKVPVRYKKE